MKISKKFELVLNEEEFNDLFAILAYTGGSVEYKPEATQHETIKNKAKHFWSEFMEASG